MANTLYTAKAHVTGGRAEGHGRSSDGALEVDLRIPAEMGGPGGGTNPEELFAVGYAACFEGALGVVARRAKAETGDAAIDSEVSLSPDGKGGFLLAVALDVTLPGIADAADRGRPGPGRARGLPVLERHARQHRGGAHRQRRSPSSRRGGAQRPNVRTSSRARAPRP